MSERPPLSVADIILIRFVLGFLMLLGIAVFAWGFVGPAVVGEPRAEVFVDELDLPKNPDTYAKVAGILVDFEDRSATLTSILGLFILGPAGIGWWTILKAYRDEPNP